MKYALIGTGKTGGAVLSRLPKNDIVAICDINNPPTHENLSKADVIIVYVPGNVMSEVLPLLLEVKKPTVIGTTGFGWPKDLDAQLKAANVPWIIASNFSIGLNVMHYFARQIQDTFNKILPGKMQLGMFEKHHTSKLDAPSGTSIYLAKSLKFPIEEISVAREGDAKGTHTIYFNLPYDGISITHEAVDRAAFAEGTLIACDRVRDLAPGLHSFEELTTSMIRESIGNGQ